MARSAGHRPAGGPRSRNVTEKPVRVGKAAQGHNVKAVSQVGQNLGDHITERRGTVNPVERDQERSPVSAGIPQGNETNKPCGPKGEGRTLYGQSGSQQQYGSANPGRPTPARDILNDYGPDSANVRARR
jgi:hypothetical protein